MRAPDDVAVGVEPFVDRGLAGLQHRGVVARQHLHEVARRSPSRSSSMRCRERRVGLREVLLSRSARISTSALPSGCSSSSPLASESRFTRSAAQVVDVRRAAGHAGAEVAAGAAEDDREPAGHVLERVVADALDDGRRAGVAHQEPLPHDAADEHAALRRAVADHVAGDHVALGREDALARRAGRRSGRRERPLPT